MVSDSSTQEVHLSDYFEIIKRRIWVVICFFIVCSASVTLATYRATPLYKGTTKIIIEGENTNVLNAVDAATESVNFNIFENYIETQIAVINSDKIAGSVFDEFELEKDPRYAERMILGKSFQRDFSDDVSIDRLRDTRMIEVTVYNPDPKIAAALANRIADVYVQDNKRQRALTFIRNQRMASLNNDFLRLQSKLDSLSNVYGPKHPEMIALRDEIRAVGQRMGSGAETGGSAGESEDQALLEDTLTKVQESSVFLSSRMNNVSIVDRAKPRNEIAKPRRLLNVAIGIILGLAGGILLAFLVNYFDDMIKTEEDVKRHSAGTTYLGYLLSEKPRLLPAWGKSGTNGMELFVNDSASAEAYRLLRTRIHWSVTNGQSLKDLAIVGAIPREGKTTVASNLAIAFAQLNMNVLLVDADFRRGRIHKHFNLPNDQGLANVLTGGVRPESAVQGTACPGLYVMTRGKSQIDSSQLLSSSHMKKFITDAREKFDMVIYDTPPLTVIADAGLVIPLIGTVLMVARCGVTRAPLLRKGLSIVEGSSANLIGVVLNDLNSSVSRTYGAYYRAYQKGS